jgi:hypothetical protein
MEDYKINVAKYNSIQDLSSNEAAIKELSQEISREYYLFLIWLIIAIIIIILTIITLLNTSEINPAVWWVTIIFIIYCSFFIFKNLYYIL